MSNIPIASYQRQLSDLADLQKAAVVTYALLREPDAYCIQVQQAATVVQCMLCETGEERAHMLTRFLYENAVAPVQVPEILYDLCGTAVG